MQTFTKISQKLNTTVFCTKNHCLTEFTWSVLLKSTTALSNESVFENTGRITVTSKVSVHSFFFTLQLFCRLFLLFPQFFSIFFLPKSQWTQKLYWYGFWGGKNQFGHLEILQRVLGTKLQVCGRFPRVCCQICCELNHAMECYLFETVREKDLQ